MGRRPNKSVRTEELLSRFENMGRGTSIGAQRASAADFRTCARLSSTTSSSIHTAVLSYSAAIYRTAGSLSVNGPMSRLNYGSGAWHYRRATRSIRVHVKNIHGSRYQARNDDRLRWKQVLDSHHIGRKEFPTNLFPRRVQFPTF